MCPLCGANEARTATIEGQVCYQQRDGHPCYVVMSLQAYQQIQKRLALLEKLQRHVLVDTREKYGAVPDAEIGPD